MLFPYKEIITTHLADKGREPIKVAYTKAILELCDPQLKQGSCRALSFIHYGQDLEKLDIKRDKCDALYSLLTGRFNGDTDAFERSLDCTIQSTPSSRFASLMDRWQLRFVCETLTQLKYNKLSPDDHSMTEQLLVGFFRENFEENFGEIDEEVNDDDLNIMPLIESELTHFNKILDPITSLACSYEKSSDMSVSEKISP